MRKYLLALIIVMAMSAPAFGQIINTTGIGSPHDNQQNQNTNTFVPVNTNVDTNINTFVPVNTNIQGQQQGQIQGQLQGQLQGQNNDQNIKQNVSFKSPTQLLAPPSQGLSELNFGNGRMKDATSELPNFAIYGIGALGREPIREVLSVNANVKFKNLYKAILDDAKDIAGNGSKTFKDIRYQVMRAEAQKSWTTGGNLGGAGSGVATSGLAGGSMAGSIIPQWGGTKADPLYTIFFVQVNDGSPSKVILYEKKSEAPKSAAPAPSVESKGWFKF